MIPDKKDMLTIKQIIPATGWCASYTKDGNATDKPLVCWALVDVDGETAVVGMFSDTEQGSCDFVSETEDYFEGYVYMPLG